MYNNGDEDWRKSIEKEELDNLIDDWSNPTNEEREKIIVDEIGFNMGGEEYSVQKFIETCRKLKSIGVDLSKMLQKDTIESLLQKQNIDIENAKEVGIDISDSKINNIGGKFTRIKSIYNGNSREMRVTYEQFQIIENELGLSLKRQRASSKKEAHSLKKQVKDTIPKFIETCRKLKSIGVDLSKMTQSDTIQTLLMKQNINIEEAEKIGIDLYNNNIGRKFANMKCIYNGTYKGTKPTEEQTQIIENELGLSLKKNKDANTKFIETCRKLKSIGVDLSEMTPKDTIETLLKEQNIDINKAKEVGIDTSDSKINNIGSKFNRIKSIYNGRNKDGMMATEEQVQIIENELGLSFEEQVRNTTQEFIETCRKLKSIGVDLSQMQKKDTIETLLKKQNIDIDKAKKIGIDIFDKKNKNIGQKFSRIKQLYNGTSKGTKPTKKQVQIIENELGLSFNKQIQIIKNELEPSLKPKKTRKKLSQATSQLSQTTQKFIETCRKLESIGVDVSKMKQMDTIETLLEKQNIDIEKAKKIGIDTSDSKINNIGKKFHRIKNIYNGNKDGIRATDEQVKIIENEFGLSLEPQKSEKNSSKTTQEFIETCRKLKSIGVDVSKIRQRDTIELLLIKQNIDINKAKEVGIDTSDDKIDNIGSKFDRIKRIYNENMCEIMITEEEAQIIENELGLSLEIQKPKIKLRQARKGYNDAKKTNDEAKQLEAKFINLTKEKGKNHGEQ